jgi:2-methylisocitrate lyase-like PEP mutase family enzyme
MSDAAAKRAQFRALHAQGCFVLPNPWDVGSARLLQGLGFKALASTSSGYAWTMGRPDYGVTRDDVLMHLAELCAATNLPVNADFQEGFADTPDGVAANVTLAVSTGVAGLSIEDRKLGGGGLYDFDYAVARIRAAKAAIQRTGQDVILVARTEGLLSNSFPVETAIERLVAFAEAGADCLYAPGITGKDNIAAMVRAIEPKPLNVLMSGPGLSVAELADLGVRRISVGGALARVVWGAMLKVSEQIKQGSFDGLADAASGKTLNGIFSEFVRKG